MSQGIDGAAEVGKAFEESFDGPGLVMTIEVVVPRSMYQLFAMIDDIQDAANYERYLES